MTVRAWTALLLAVLAALTQAACTDREERAIDAATRYFATEVDRADPSWASLFGYMHRRFGLEATDAHGRALHLPPPDAAAPTARIYRRIDDPGATVEVDVIEALPTVVDRMTAAALHCDRLPLPDNWPQILGHATEVGGYALTHAALATQWTLENGCSRWGDLSELRHRQIEALSALASDRAGLLAAFDTPMDLWLEAMAMLDYLGAGSRIEPEWIDELVAAQRPDGGLPVHPRARASDPHPTALALWVLLQRARPEAIPIRWIAAPPRLPGPDATRQAR